MFESLPSVSRSTSRRGALTLAAVAHALAAGSLLVASVWGVEAVSPPEKRPVLVRESPIPVQILEGDAADSPQEPSPPSTSTPPIRRPAVVAQPTSPDPATAPSLPASSGASVGEDPTGTGIAGERVPGAVAGDAPDAPSAIAEGDRIYRPSEVEVVPLAADCRPPVYPKTARALGIHGRVVLDAVIGVEGQVERVQVIEGHALLAEAASRALAGCRFTPGRLRGRSVRSLFRWEVSFELH